MPKPGAFPSAPAAMMQAQAETIADELRTKVGTLVATDTQLATGLANATATLGTTVFPESADEPSTSANKPAVQFVDLVDYKQDVPDPNQPGPSSDEIRKVLDELPGETDREFVRCVRPKTCRLSGNGWRRTGLTWATGTRMERALPRASPTA